MTDFRGLGRAASGAMMAGLTLVALLGCESPKFDPFSESTPDPLRNRTEDIQCEYAGATIEHGETFRFRVGDLQGLELKQATASVLSGPADELVLTPAGPLGEFIATPAHIHGPDHQDEFVIAIDILLGGVRFPEPGSLRVTCPAYGGRLTVVHRGLDLGIEIERLAEPSQVPSAPQSAPTPATAPVVAAPATPPPPTPTARPAAATTPPAAATPPPAATAPPAAAPTTPPPPPLSAFSGTRAVTATVPKNPCGWSPYEGTVELQVAADGSARIVVKGNRPDSGWQRTYNGKIDAAGSFAGSGSGNLNVPGTNTNYTADIAGKITSGKLTATETVRFPAPAYCEDPNSDRANQWVIAQP